jgi:hypothetical protein
MRWRARAAVALAVLVSLGCAGRSRGGGGESEPPASAAPAPEASLSLAMLGTDGEALTDGEAFDRLFAAPEVSAAGERLLARLGNEASLEPLYVGFTTRMWEQPALLESITRLTAAEPGASVETIVATSMSRLSAGIDGPAFDAALDAALDRVLDRPSVDAAFGRMSTLLVERARFRERLVALMLDWQPELEAAVDVPMTDERFAARLEQHLADPARASAIRALFAERMIDAPRVREGLVALLDDAAFSAACVEVVRTLLGDPSFDARAASVLAGMIDEVDREELTRRVEKALVTPELEAAVVTWVEAVTQSPAFATLAEQLGAVLDDPSVQAELLAIVAGTPARRTA